MQYLMHSACPPHVERNRSSLDILCILCRQQMFFHGDTQSVHTAIEYRRQLTKIKIYSISSITERITFVLAAAKPSGCLWKAWKNAVAFKIMVTCHAENKTLSIVTRIPCQVAARPCPTSTPQPPNRLTHFKHWTQFASRIFAMSVLPCGWYRWLYVAHFYLDRWITYTYVYVKWKSTASGSHAVSHIQARPNFNEPQHFMAVYDLHRPSQRHSPPTFRPAYRPLMVS